MKTFFALIFSLLLSVQILSGAPHSFAEFKALPQKERDTLVAAAEDTDSHDSYVNWWWRLYIGEERWQRKEGERLADQNGHIQIRNLFIEYQHLREHFLSQEFARKKAVGMSGKELIAEREHYTETAQANSAIYQNAIPLIAALAPTDGARTLDKKADEIVTAWFKQWPDGSQWVLTHKDMTAIDQTVEKVLDQLRSLPRLSITEVQAAINGLPPDHPHVAGLPIPHK